MKRMMLAVGALALGLLAGPASAGTEICKVELTSPEVGRLEVRKVMLPPKAEALLHDADMVFSMWSPPVSGSVDLTMGYVAHDQDKVVGAPTSVSIEFPVSKDVTPDQFSAEITAEGEKSVHLGQAAGLAGSDRFGYVLDGTLPPDDRAMGRLIATGGHVKIVIFQADWVIQPEMVEGTEMRLKVLGPPKAIISEEIDTTATVARDALFTQGKAPVIALDPKVCTPTP